MTPTTALGLVVVSAAMHAGWNLMVKQSGDRLLAMWGQTTLGALGFLPVFFVHGTVDAGLWPVVLASAVLHVAYGVTLATAYRHADLSAVYPVARGVAPVLVTAGSVAFLHDPLRLPTVVGVALVSGGVTWVGTRGAWSRGLVWAVACGGLTAAYTLVDAAAVREAGDSLRYAVALFSLMAALFTVVAVTARGRRRVQASVRRFGWSYLAAGVLSLGAYVLVLVAARIAPVGPVAAVRETAIVLGALGGWLLLGEQFGPRRVVGAAVVAAGVAVLATT